MNVPFKSYYNQDIGGYFFRTTTMTNPNLGLGLYLNPMNGEEYVKPLSLTLTV